MDASVKQALEKLNKDLPRAAEKLRHYQKLLAKHEGFCSDLSQKKESLHWLEEEFKKEQRDYEKLTRLNLHSLFHQVLGNKEKQVEKERQEYLAALLKFNQCRGEIESLQMEIDRLEGELETLKTAQAEYENILKQKEQLLLSHPGEEGMKLLLNSEKIASQEAHTRETAEALHAGRNCLQEIENMIHSLRNAKGWGTWDLMGGGILSTLIKHSKVDDARRSLQRVQHLVMVFNKELKDVGGQEHVMPEFSGIQKFADIFLDNLITDWIVQSRITTSLQNTFKLHRRIQQAVVLLELKLRQSTEAEEKIKEERKKLLETC